MFWMIMGLMNWGNREWNNTEGYDVIRFEVIRLKMIDNLAFVGTVSDLCDDGELKSKKIFVI